MIPISVVILKCYKYNRGIRHINWQSLSVTLLFPMCWLCSHKDIVPTNTLHTQTTWLQNYPHPYATRKALADRIPSPTHSNPPPPPLIIHFQFIYFTGGAYWKVNKCQIKNWRQKHNLLGGSLPNLIICSLWHDQYFLIISSKSVHNLDKVCVEKHNLPGGWLPKLNPFFIVLLSTFPEYFIQRCP